MFVHAVSPFAIGRTCDIAICPAVAALRACALDMVHVRLPFLIDVGVSLTYLPQRIRMDRIHDVVAKQRLPCVREFPEGLFNEFKVLFGCLLVDFSAQSPDK